MTPRNLFPRMLAFSALAEIAAGQCNNSIIDLEFVIDDSLSLGPTMVSDSGQCEPFVTDHAH